MLRRKRGHIFNGSLRLDDGVRMNQASFRSIVEGVPWTFRCGCKNESSIQWEDKEILHSQHSEDFFCIWRIQTDFIDILGNGHEPTNAAFFEALDGNDIRTEVHIVFYKLLSELRISHMKVA